AQPTNNAFGRLTDERMAAIFFPRVGVRKVNFDQRSLQRTNGIQQRNGSVSQARAVEYHASRALAGLLQPADQLALAVGLAEYDGNTEASGPLLNHLANFGKRHAAIDLRLTRPQEIE